MSKELLTENNSPSIADYQQLYKAFVSQMDDLKIVKDSIGKIVAFMGMANDDGTIKDKPNVKKIMALAMSLATNPDKLKTELSFLSDLMPLVEKYKDL